MTPLQLQSVAAGLVAAALAFPTTFVVAQETYPSKPVRLVVPFPPAGPK